MPIMTGKRKEFLLTPNCFAFGILVQWLAVAPARDSSATEVNKCKDNVKDNRFGGRLLDALQRFCPVRGSLDRVALLAEEGGDQQDNVRFILGDQDIFGLWIAHDTPFLARWILGMGHDCCAFLDGATVK
jgi:hypothetical protein